MMNLGGYFNESWEGYGIDENLVFKRRKGLMGWG